MKSYRSVFPTASPSLESLGSFKNIPRPRHTRDLLNQNLWGWEGGVRWFPGTAKVPITSLLGHLSPPLQDSDGLLCVWWSCCVLLFFNGKCFCR